MGKIKVLVIICFIGWLLRHFIIFPVIDWEEHEVTGIELRIKF